MILLFDNSSAKYNLLEKKLYIYIKQKDFDDIYSFTFDIVSFEFADISLRVSLRNLIIIFNDWLSLLSDVVCCELFISKGFIGCSWIGERLDSVVVVGIGICSELNSSPSLDLCIR